MWKKIIKKSAADEQFVCDIWVLIENFFVHRFIEI